MRRRAALLGVALLLARPATAQLVAYRVEGDSIPGLLAAAPGDPARGRAVFANREISTCLLCHAEPSAPAAQEAIGPSLRGVGARLTEGQIRLRLADPARLDPNTVMPSFYAIDGLNRVGLAWQGRPVLSAAQIEDLVAFLVTLRAP